MAGSSFRRFVARVAVGALAVAVPVGVWTPTAASAATPTDLLFSEYVEGSGFNKAIEIYRGTGSPVDLVRRRVPAGAVQQRVVDGEQLTGAVGVLWTTARFSSRRTPARAHRSWPLRT